MKPENQNNPWIEIGMKDQVQDGLYFVGSDEVWLTTRAGQYTVVSNICPHKMGPLSQGKCKGDLVQCPWHGYWFNIKTDKYTPAFKLRRYEIKEEKARIFIRLIQT